MLLIIVAIIAFSCLSQRGEQNAVPGTGSTESAVSINDSALRVSFVAVGDNVPNDVIGAYAAEQASVSGSGEYDYRPLFAHVKPYIQDADIAYIDQETHIGGNDIGPRGYPSFNTTDEMANAVVDAGFDLVGSATNHAYDWGYFGAIEHSRAIWNAQPVAFTGTATSWDEANEIPIIERKGLKFALLNYTYGVNGYEQGDIEGYYVNFIDEERIRKDVARAQDEANVVIAAMHWGIENETKPSDEERSYAQLLADLGVDVIVGSHPHVIQPMTWLEGKSGKRTLVCYSLGNFIIQHDDPTHDNDLEGMMTCDFVKHEGSQDISIDNVRWIPLVYHGEEGALSVWPLKDYSDELARRNPAYADLDDPRQWLVDESIAVVNALGDDFEIVTNSDS